MERSMMIEIAFIAGIIIGILFVMVTMEVKF